MKVRNVALLGVMMVLTGSVIAFGFGGTAFAATGTPTISTSQQPASATVGSSIADKATVSAPPSNFTCPPEDEAGFPLGQSNTSTDPIFCSYPAFAGENPNDFFCTYSASSGALVTDNDAGFCPATAVGTPAGTPTGTVTFNLYNNSTGSGTPLFTDTESLSGGSATSAGHTATATGTDYWVATYNGDSNFNPVSSGNGDEPVTINQAPAITSGASASFATGQSGTFTVTTTGSPTASLSDGGASLPNGVTFTDNGDGTATLTGIPDSGTVGTYPFTITASNGVSPDATQSFTLSVVDPPRNGRAPVVSGTAQVGEILKSTPGGWTSTDGPLTFSYQWQRCESDGSNCQPITPAQTHYGYKLTKADVDHQITVAVTATDRDNHPSTVLAAPRGPVTTPAPVNTSLPVVSGNTQVGQTLKTSPGKWTSQDGPLSYTYQWQRCESDGSDCQAISPAQTHYGYKLTKADVDHQITVAVTATDQGNQATTQAATPVGPVTTAAPVNTSLPVVSGNTQVGQTLKTSPGKWTSQDGPLSYTYQWQRCESDGSNCQPITPAQTHYGYKLTNADVDHQITVAVTATDQANQATSETATPVGPVTS